MTEQQIIDDWFDKKENRDKIHTFSYPKIIYDFIVGSMPHRLERDADSFYKIADIWIKIIKKQNQTT